MYKHLPVMLNECIETLNIKPDGIYLDLTLGRAGHSAAILKKLKTGLLIAFDKDIDAIKESGPILSNISDNFKLVHSDFKNIENELAKLNITKVDGVLVDLGVSSPQIDQSHRGFSYNKDAKLDMRMDQKQELSAHNIVNEWDRERLIKIFQYNADVKFFLSERIANAIIEKRPIDTTLQLADIVRESLPAAVVRKKNMCKPIFQAIRMEVNNELDSIRVILKKTLDLLNADGVFVVITFHSIEDKIVKKYFHNLAKDDSGQIPIVPEKSYIFKTKKPNFEETQENNRSRSARLRILRKVSE